MDSDTKIFYVASVTYLAITGSAINDLAYKYLRDETGSIAASRAGTERRTVQEVAEAYKDLYVCALINPVLYWFSGHIKPN